MNASQQPPILGLSTSRRSIGHNALLELAQDLIVARFALVRALHRLETEQLLDVLDEVAETIERASSQWRDLKVTPRNEDLGHTE